MAVESTNTQTAVVGTEHILAAPSTYGNRALIVDGSTLLAGDTVELRLKGPVVSGGATRLVRLAIFTGPITEDNLQSMPGLMPYGGTITLKQTTGTARAFDWTIVALP